MSDGRPRGRSKCLIGFVSAGALLSLSLLQTSCILLVIPHQATEHGSIRGRVVDDETGHPIPGVRVAVGDRDAEPEATTDADGMFAIAELEDWRYLWAVPLAPFDSFSLPDTIHLDYPGVVPNGESRRVYRELSIDVRSYRPSRIIGDRGQGNRGLQDDLGTIRLKTLELPPRH